MTNVDRLSRLVRWHGLFQVGKLDAHWAALFLLDLTTLSEPEKVAFFDEIMPSAEAAA